MPNDLADADWAAFIAKLETAGGVREGAACGILSSVVLCR